MFKDSKLDNFVLTASIIIGTVTIYIVIPAALLIGFGCLVYYALIGAGIL